MIILLFTILLALLSSLLWYTEIQILYFVLALVLLIFLFCLSYKFKNIYLFVFCLVLTILLIPSIYFYIDLLQIYPYLTSQKNKIQEMKKDCSIFLDRHFNCKSEGLENLIGFENTRVIYVLNHHTQYNKLLDMLYHLKIPGNNSIVVTGGKTRYKVIDNLYTNLNHIKLSKSDKGNMEIFLEKCVEKFRQGNNIVVFPEGKYTNAKEDWKKMKAFQTGTFILSKTYNVPIIPVLISGGNYDHGLIMSSEIKMKYLEPFYPQDYYSVEEYKNEVFEYMNFHLSYL